MLINTFSYNSDNYRLWFSSSSAAVLSFLSMIILMHLTQCTKSLSSGFTLFFSYLIMSKSWCCFYTLLMRFLKVSESSRSSRSDSNFFCSSTSSPSLTVIYSLFYLLSPSWHRVYIFIRPLLASSITSMSLGWVIAPSPSVICSWRDPKTCW